MLPILFNPESGSRNGEAVALELKSFLESRQIQGKLFPTRDVQDLQHLSEKLDLPQGVLACVGGDGTLHQCVKARYDLAGLWELLQKKLDSIDASLEHSKISQASAVFINWQTSCLWIANLSRQPVWL